MPISGSGTRVRSDDVGGASCIPYISTYLVEITYQSDFCRSRPRIRTWLGEREEKERITCSEHANCQATVRLLTLGRPERVRDIDRNNLR